MRPDVADVSDSDLVQLGHNLWFFKIQIPTRWGLIGAITLLTEMTIILVPHMLKKIGSLNRAGDVEPDKVNVGAQIFFRGAHIFSCRGRPCIQFF